MSKPKTATKKHTGRPEKPEHLKQGKHHFATTCSDVELPIAEATITASGLSRSTFLRAALGLPPASV